MIITKKQTLGELTGYERELYPGLIMIKLVSTMPISPDAIKDLALENLLQNIDVKITNMTRNEEYHRDIEYIKQAKLVYSKCTEIDLDGNQYHYYQMVYDMPDNTVAQANYLRSSRIYNIGWALRQDLTDGRGENYVVSTCYANNISYSITNVKVNANGNMTPCTIIGAPEWGDKIFRIINPSNDIAFNCKFNHNRAYNKNLLIKFRYEIYDSLEEAFANRTTDTYMISQFDRGLGNMYLMRADDRYNGSTIFRLIYNNNIKCYRYKDMFVFYDGQKALDTCKFNLEYWYETGIRQLDVLQYAYNRDLFYQTGGDERIGKLVLHFIHKTKIFAGGSDLRWSANQLQGRVVCQPKRDGKKTGYEITLQARFPFIGQVLVPVDENNIQERAIYVLNNIFDCIRNNAMNTNASKEYEELLFGSIQCEDDVLSRWFEYCTKSSINTDDKIVRAYQQMKTNLENEYRELGVYLNCYDFSKCNPVPRLKLDKKTKENFYNCLHIEAKNIIIKKINNKSINPIQETRPMITIMVPDLHNKLMYKVEYPLMKYYNARENSLEFDFNKMKGEVIRDKTKNRR